MFVWLYCQSIYLHLFTYVYFHNNIFVAYIVYLALITIVTLNSSHWKNYIFSTFVALLLGL